MFFYQTPWIPELLLQSNDFKMFSRVFWEKPMGLINPSNMTNDDLEVFKYTFSQKGLYFDFFTLRTIYIYISLYILILFKVQQRQQ